MRALDPPLYAVQVGSFVAQPAAARVAAIVEAEHVAGRYYDTGFFNADGGPSFGTVAHIDARSVRGVA